MASCIHYVDESDVAVDSSGVADEEPWTKGAEVATRTRGKRARTGNETASEAGQGVAVSKCTESGC